MTRAERRRIQKLQLKEVMRTAGLSKRAMQTEMNLDAKMSLNAKSMVVGRLIGAVTQSMNEAKKDLVQVVEEAKLEDLRPVAEDILTTQEEVK
jgi:hypothetical protein